MESERCSSSLFWCAFWRRTSSHFAGKRSSRLMARLAHLSDIHFGMENAAALEATAAWLAAAHPDLVIITGDITAFGEPAEFASAAAWISAVQAARLVVPGNHDTP